MMAAVLLLMEVAIQEVDSWTLTSVTLITY